MFTLFTSQLTEIINSNWFIKNPNRIKSNKKKCGYKESQAKRPFTVESRYQTDWREKRLAKSDGKYDNSPTNITHIKVRIHINCNMLEWHIMYLVALKKLIFTKSSK